MFRHGPSNKMRVSIVDLQKKELKKIDLPSQFDEKVRPDIIKKAVLALQANKRQVYGADLSAGKKTAVRVSKRRRDYRGSYGHGISRVPRKVLSRRGTRFNWQGAFAPGTVKGRRAHPPKTEKVWQQKINKKERKKAIRSALAATVDKEYVKERGHLIPDDYPFVIENKVENLKKTKDIKKILDALGFEKELNRLSKKSVRAGKGKRRGRKYKKKAGILIVVSDKCWLQKAVKNIPGIETAIINKLNAELLAPGTLPGRATIFTEAAIDKIARERLFM